jgi:hypothetical protein
VKDGWKEQFWGQRYYLSKLRSLLSFPLVMTSHRPTVKLTEIV